MHKEIMSDTATAKTDDEATIVDNVSTEGKEPTEGKVVSGHGPPRRILSVTKPSTELTDA